MAVDEWIISFEDSVEVDALHRALFAAEQKAVDDAKGTSDIEFLIVDRFRGLRVDVFAREHPPPHFRVYCQGISATFTIRDCSPLGGNLGRYQRVIQDWHKRNKPKLIETWNRTRPSDCPVGQYEDA